MSAKKYTKELVTKEGKKAGKSTIVVSNTYLKPILNTIHLNSTFLHAYSIQCPTLRMIGHWKVHATIVFAPTFTIHLNSTFLYYPLSNFEDECDIGRYMPPLCLHQNNLCILLQIPCTFWTFNTAHLLYAVISLDVCLIHSLWHPWSMEDSIKTSTEEVHIPNRIDYG